jgi:hypothetical protein
MRGAGRRVEVNREVRGPGDMGGNAGQAVADIHDTGDTVVGQDSGGVEAGPGVATLLTTCDHYYGLMADR